MRYLRFNKPNATLPSFLTIVSGNLTRIKNIWLLNFGSVEIFAQIFSPKAALRNNYEPKYCYVPNNVFLWYQICNLNL